mgnify:CR=1 FL=1
MRKSFYYLLFLLVTGLYSCLSEAPIVKKIAKGEKVYGGEVSYESPEIVNQFFPLSCISMYEQRAISPVFETLIQYNEETKSLSGNLISSFTVSKDLKTIDLIVQKGVYFHNDPCFKGKKEELSAEDIKFTLDFACTPHKLNQQSQLLIGKIKGAKEFFDSFEGKFSLGVSGIKVLTKYSLRIELTNPSPTFLKTLTHQSISVFSKKAYNYYKDRIQQHPIGTGPFTLFSSNDKERVYVRNANYWRFDEYKNQLPFLNKIHVKYPTTNNTFSSFATQKTDLLLSIPANEINSLFGTLDEAKKGKNILHKLQFRKGLKISYIGFDCSAGPFNDIHLRKAIFHAVNRELICRQFMFGESNPAENGILPKGAYFEPTISPENPFNMNLAKYHIRKSRYKGDSILFFASVKEESPEREWCESVIVDLNQTLGLKIRLITGSYNEKLTSIQSGEAKMWMGAYIPDYPDAESYLNPYYSNTTGNSIRAIGKYQSMAFDEIFEKSTREVDDSVRNELFNSCIKIMNKEAPVVPVYFDNLLVVYNLNLRDANMNSFGIIDFSKAYIKPIK